jgi:hypothetical protein
MARRPFDNNGNAQVLDPLTGNALSGRSVTFWSAKTGGTQYTDLQDSLGNALAGGVATTDTYGLFSIQGPADGTAKLWADAGYERVLIFATDTTDRVASVETSSANNANSISLITGAKGQPNGYASLGLDGRLPQSQLTAGTFRTSWFSVLDYGAVGDGATDDTAAIQAAINAAHAYTVVNPNGGGLVYFPSASYKITSALTVYNNLTLLGSGDGNTQIKASSLTGINALTGSALSNVVIEKLSFLGTATSGNSAAINFTAPVGANLNQLIALRDVSISSFRGDGVYILNAETCSLSKVSVNNVSGTGWGVNFDANTTQLGPVYMSACQATSPGGAFRLAGIGSGTADACWGYSCPTGFLLDTNTTSFTLNGCSTSQCTVNGIKINAGNASGVGGNCIQGYVDYSSTGTAGTVYVTNNSQAVTINSAVQGSGTANPFIKTDAGTQVLLQQCTALTGNSIAAGTQVAAGVKAFTAVNTTSPQSVTNTETDITGCSITLTTIGTNTQCVVMGDFNFSVGSSSSGTIDGKLSVDGVVNGTFARVVPITSTVQAMATQTWLVTLAAAGSHTLKLRAVVSGTGTYATGNNNTTTITVLQLSA